MDACSVTTCSAEDGVSPVPQYTVDGTLSELEAFIEDHVECFDLGDIWEIRRMRIGDALVFDDGAGGDLVVRRVR